MPPTICAGPNPRYLLSPRPAQSVFAYHSHCHRKLANNFGDRATDCLYYGRSLVGRSLYYYQGNPCFACLLFFSLFSYSRHSAVLGYFNHFDDSHLLVLQSEQYFDNKEAVLAARVYPFLSLPNTSSSIVGYDQQQRSLEEKGRKPRDEGNGTATTTTPPKKAPKNARSYPPLDAETRNMLWGHLRPFNHLLYKLLETRSIPFQPWRE